MDYDNRAMAAALINAAVKGCIEIRQQDRVYTIARKGGDEEALSREEKIAVHHLLGSKDSIELKQENWKALSSATKATESSLIRQFRKPYFMRHERYTDRTILLVIPILLLGWWLDPVGSVEVIEGKIVIGLAIWAMVNGALVSAAGLMVWRSFGMTRLTIVPSLLALAALSSCAGEVHVVFTYAPYAWTPLVGAAFLLTFVNHLFRRLLKSYTPLGRELMDKAEGLRLYLSTAEEERLDSMNPPERTPALFEKLLPYALALDVEQAWSEKFAALLGRAQLDGYQPDWYSGTAFARGGYGGFASSMGGSLASAISSSSSSPGSSGGGGGGSSGGGGGGGGGGGW